jgi:hypothetical protein
MFLPIETTAAAWLVQRVSRERRSPEDVARDRAPWVVGAADVPAVYPRVVRPGDKKCQFAGLSYKPSDGLEPSTPSLPWKFGRVTRVHVRSLVTQFFLQIETNDLSRMRREGSRVSSLMCPFCVRVLSSALATGPS